MDPDKELDLVISRWSPSKNRSAGYPFDSGKAMLWSDGVPQFASVDVVCPSPSYGNSSGKQIASRITSFRSGQIYRRMFSSSKKSGPKS